MVVVVGVLLACGNRLYCGRDGLLVMFEEGGMVRYLYLSVVNFLPVLFRRACGMLLLHSNKWCHGPLCGEVVVTPPRRQRGRRRPTC